MVKMPRSFCRLAWFMHLRLECTFCRRASGIHFGDTAWRITRCAADAAIVGQAGATFSLSSGVTAAPADAEPAHGKCDARAIEAPVRVVMSIALPFAARRRRHFARLLDDLHCCVSAGCHLAE